MPPVSLSAANPYLNDDGLLNMTAVSSLNGKIAKAAAKVEGNKVNGVYYTSKPLPKYSAALEKKGDHKYRALRGQQIKMRSRVPAGMPKPEMVIKKGSVFLVNYVELPPELAKEVKVFQRAIDQHNRKGLKVVDKVKGEKAKIRDAANAEYDQNIAELRELLEGQIKPASIVEGQSMFGKTVIIKLPGGGYIGIGKSDAQKFNAAKKSASAPKE